MNIAIYTCITGGYDIPTDGFEHKDGYDYFLFSDVAIPTKSWKNITLTFNNADTLTNAKKQRFIKTHPFEILKDYDIVVWIDANTDINDKLYKYIEDNKNNLITFKIHPTRDCIYDEIKTCIKARKETPEMGVFIYKKLKADGYPEHNGLYETNIIVSHAQNDKVKQLLTKWWEEIYKFSHRDQLSLNYVIWKNHLEEIVTGVKSNDFKPKTHKKLIFQEKQSEVKKSTRTPNIDMFITAYKDFSTNITNKAYKVIVGNHSITNKSNLRLINCKQDDILDDKFYSELYMYKYVRKKCRLKQYVGFCHYRKYFNFLDNIPNMDEIFNKYDCIVAKPLQWKETVKEQYAKMHNIEDLNIIEKIIDEKYPEYSHFCKVFLNGHLFIPYNMFIMKREDFKRYCDFVFGVLNEYTNIVGTDINKRIEDNKEKYLKRFYPNNTIEYQYRIGGYLAERLTNIFLMNNFKKMKTYGIAITETKYNKKG